MTHVHAAETAFAAVKRDGSVVTWGHPEYGGVSSSVQPRLRDVQQIEASLGAFAAVTTKGEVVTWGHAAYGGDSNIVPRAKKFRWIALKCMENQ